MKARKKILLWSLVGGVAIVGLALLSQFPRPTPFDPSLWRASGPSPATEHPRLEMADDLIARGTLRGKSEAEVVALLGPTDDEGYYSDADLVYWLGPDRGFIGLGIDSEWLIVDLNDEGFVDRYYITTD